MPKLFYLFPLFLLALLPAHAQMAGSAESPEIQVAQAINKFLPGFKFNKRLAVGQEADHVLLFEKGEDVLVVGWTDGADATVQIPASRGYFTLYDTAGNSFATAESFNNVVIVTLRNAPVFIVPDAPNGLLRMAVTATRVPPAIQVKGPTAVPLSVTFTNVLDEPFLLSLEDGTKMQALRPGQSYIVQRELDMGRQSEPFPVLIGANGIEQRIMVQATNPIGISLSPDVGGSLVLSFLNPSGEAFRAKAELRLIDAGMDPLKFDVAMGRGQRTMDFQIPLASDEPIPYAMQVVLLDTMGEGLDSRRIVLAESPITQFLSAADFRSSAPGEPVEQFQVTAAAGAELSATGGAPTDGLPNVSDGGMELLYQFKQGGGAVAINPLTDAFRIIEAQPVALGMWVYGDGSGLTPSIVLMDSTGRKIACPGEPIVWKGWNYMRFELDEPMVPPLLLDSLFRLQNGSSPSFGRLYLNDPNWIYEVNSPANPD
ncbi:hypothetical protein [Ruficoccus sp. ZRK36]|uniref:hypothetical protein n=1 Tax=Ruficoccus sp. ZRK36 TaxID=2866311 RepID=UPI001C72EB7D|nr:hypothetical protein [Ruficoccus sp. ZRK36]QYY35942.1 hypothetical protein K0V07_00370 [Ruficoccus sp. ZRK36]